MAFIRTRRSHPMPLKPEAGRGRAAPDRAMAGLALGALLLTGGAASQEIFSDPENLEVLPEDISPTELRNTMRMFAIGTGSRCETCHVGEADQPLETFDFASDEKEEKRVARKMLKMVNAINEQHIGQLDGERMKVQCVTCHRGVPVPKTTEQVLSEVLAEEGVEQAEQRYRELRDRYYGTHSYDFSEFLLVGLAHEATGAGNPEAATALLRLNLEFFPESFMSFYGIGRAAVRSGDPEQARQAFEKALEIGGPPRFVEAVRSELESLESED